MNLGGFFLDSFVALYTLRQVWNHGHHGESVGILGLALLLTGAQIFLQRRK